MSHPTDKPKHQYAEDFLVLSLFLEHILLIIHQLKVHHQNHNFHDIYYFSKISIYKYCFLRLELFHMVSKLLLCKSNYLCIFSMYYQFLSQYRMGNLHIFLPQLFGFRDMQINSCIRYPQQRGYHKVHNCPQLIFSFNHILYISYFLIYNLYRKIDIRIIPHRWLFCIQKMNQVGIIIFS